MQRSARNNSLARSDCQVLLLRVSRLWWAGPTPSYISLLPSKAGSPLRRFGAVGPTCICYFLLGARDGPRQVGGCFRLIGVAVILYCPYYSIFIFIRTYYFGFCGFFVFFLKESINCKQGSCNGRNICC